VDQDLAALRKFPPQSETVVQTVTGPAYAALAKPLAGNATGANASASLLVAVLVSADNH
jgi:hypothetical protein